MNAPADPEWVRVIDIRHLPASAVEVVADEAERRRLAGRFGLSAIDRLAATVRFEADADRITVTGRISAAIVQACAISGEDFATTIDEPVALRFVPMRDAVPPDEEVELSAEECDEIDYAGLTFDLGEALAQTLALSIDPFAQGPDADRARAEHGLSGTAASGPFAALSALKTRE
jgi:uncharacterized metal-binding protein YceD (DUF177 family)